MDLPSQSTVFLWNTVINLGKDKCSCWRRERLPTLVFLLGEFHGQRSLAGYSPQGSKHWTCLSNKLNSCFLHCRWILYHLSHQESPLGKDVCLNLDYQVVLVVKNLPANVGDIRNMGSVPGSGRSPARKLGNPPQYSCLANPMDRGAWQAAVYRVTKSSTQLKQLNVLVSLS